MRIRISGRGLAAFAVLLALVLASIATARQSNLDTELMRRMNTMIAARAALSVLGKMARGRVVFNRGHAKAARHDLIAALRTIPRRFRKPHTNTGKGTSITQARPEIWTRWDEFSIRAASAKRAARAIRVNSLPALQSTLPRLLRTCLDCHRVFRTPDS